MANTKKLYKSQIRNALSKMHELKVKSKAMNITLIENDKHLRNTSNNILKEQGAAGKYEKSLQKKRSFLEEAQKAQRGMASKFNKVKELNVKYEEGLCAINRVLYNVLKEAACRCDIFGY